MDHNGNKDIIAKNKLMLSSILLNKQVLNYFVRKIRHKVMGGGNLPSSDVLAAYCKHNHSVDSWVDRMGSWNSTRQGHQFWADINAEFIHAIYNKTSIKMSRCRSIW